MSSTVVISARYCYSYDLKGDEMDRASSTNGEDKQYKILVRTPQGSRPFRKRIVNEIIILKIVIG
jgi:hypothetical protein